jgi:hypothetical protein
MKANSSVVIFFVLANYFAVAQTGTYSGSGSVTQGLGTTTTANLMPNCPSNHTTPLGTITASDATVWTVPASNNFAIGPFASDLYNPCNGVTPTSLATSNLASVPTTIIDAGGDVITAYIFSDNYFEMYINGVLVGVDAIPFTPFNSAVIKFKVSRPYTIGVKLVDWEEHLGLGSEIQSSTSQYHAGDGGFIAQFSDGTVTNASWKAQTFYIAPIENLSSVVELPNGTRSTATATTMPSCNGNCYGIHYAIPSNWNSVSYSDSAWPSATLYTATAVTNDLSYTRFATTAWNNASFIWSSNLILDNLVLVRKTVNSLGVNQNVMANPIRIKNPFLNQIEFSSDIDLDLTKLTLFDQTGRIIQQWNKNQILKNETTELILNTIITNGLYYLSVKSEDKNYTLKIIKN